MLIENSKECFVRLWRKLELTRLLLWSQHRRFCVRRIVKSWMGLWATDDVLWEICHLADVDGYQLLPPPALNPYQHREILRALVAVRTGIGMKGVNLQALDSAYSDVFPGSRRIDVRKKAVMS